MFSVTYDIVTPESAEHGDTDEAGFISQELTLRDAIAAVFATRTNEVDGVLCIEWSGDDRRWLTVTNGMEYQTGAYESRSLHIPEHVTAATRDRIGRLVSTR